MTVAHTTVDKTSELWSKHLTLSLYVYGLLRDAWQFAYLDTVPEIIFMEISISNNKYYWHIDTCINIIMHLIIVTSYSCWTVIVYFWSKWCCFRGYFIKLWQIMYAMNQNTEYNVRNIQRFLGKELPWNIPFASWSWVNGVMFVVRKQIPGAPFTNRD